MIELILATLNNILARLLDAVISWWGKELMPLSMAEMTKKIPFLATGYSVFQSMALAFAIIIAAFSIYSVFLSAGESRTSPVRVLVMTGVSTWQGKADACRNTGTHYSVLQDVSALLNSLGVEHCVFVDTSDLVVLGPAYAQDAESYGDAPDPYDAVPPEDPAESDGLEGGGEV